MKGLQAFSVKGQTVNILGFVDHVHLSHSPLFLLCLQAFKKSENFSWLRAIQTGQATFIPWAIDC